MILKFALIFSFIFIACSSKQHSTRIEPLIHKGYEIYQLKFRKGSYNGYLVYIKRGSQFEKISKYTFLKGVECWIECGGKRTDFMENPIEVDDFLDFSLPITSFMVETKKDFTSEKCRSFVARFSNDILTFPVRFADERRKFFAIPNIFINSDTNFVFALDLVRLEEKEDEYFPTSERLRIRIESKAGKEIWASDFNTNFLQVIGEVEPIEIGKIRRYILQWIGKDFSGNKVPSGEYNVYFILPIKKHEIVEKLELKIEEK
ncbi:MAG: hypothetical protein N2517_07210 [Ignavibacteria bacterium]|nr:hypothetical protein [Ignavibacteria bacterium]